MNNELQREVSLKINRLGTNEFLLAYSRAETKDANNVAELVEEHRAPFTEGKVASIGAMTMASPEVWAKIAGESEAAAKRELLQNSAELAELEKLEKAASDAVKLAEAKEAELSRAWSEFNSIPEKVDAINLRLVQIANGLASLETGKIELDFKSLYRAILDGARTSGDVLDAIAARLVTANLRKGVLTQLATELKAELATLEARQRALAKKLGQKI